MSLFYAAYGSNLHPARLQQRTPSARLVTTTKLDGWQLCFHKRSNFDGSGKCNILMGQGSVHVAIFELAPADKPLLDRVEGLGNGYEEATIQLPEIGSAFVYVAAESHIDDQLKPFSWYKALVVAGCGYHKFPRPYVRVVKRIDDLRDPDSDRHDRHMSLIASFGEPISGA